MLDRFQLAGGDTVHLVETEEGILTTPFDPAFDEAREINAEDAKRVAFQAMYLFLGLNGFRIEAPVEEVVVLILSLAGGQLGEPDPAAWLRQHITPR